jgi:hypothetical protein
MARTGWRPFGGRSGLPRAERDRMGTIQDDIEQLERELMMRGLGALESGRSRCDDCGRTPLTGEQVHLYEDRPGRPPKVVCELCSQLRREQPVGRETIHSACHGQTVRVTARAI